MASSAAATRPAASPARQSAASAAARPAPASSSRAKPAPQPDLPAMEEPVIYKVERSKAVFPPEPAKTVLRRVTSEPPRMGRLVAFADGRRSGGSRRRSPGQTK